MSFLCSEGYHENINMQGSNVKTNPLLLLLLKTLRMVFHSVISLTCLEVIILNFVWYGKVDISWKLKHIFTNHCTFVAKKSIPTLRTLLFWTKSGLPRVEARFHGCLVTI